MDKGVTTAVTKLLTMASVRPCLIWLLLQTQCPPLCASLSALVTPVFLQFLGHTVSGPLHIISSLWMFFLLSSPGQSFSSCSDYMSFPPSQTGLSYHVCCTIHNSRGHHSQRLQFAQQLMATLCLAFSPSITAYLTCTALLLHSNLHIYNHLFIKCSSSSLDHQDRDHDFPIHLGILSSEQCLYTEGTQ